MSRWRAVLPGRGAMSRLPARRAGVLAAAALFWLGLQVALVVWWATVISRQARQIDALQSSGAAAVQAGEQWSRTRLMLLGESSVFLGIVLIVSALLAWLYWREQRRARSMQSFFAAVTHELRTPLTSIRLQAESIADGGASPALVRRLLEDSHRLESQIDKTLELARIEGGGPLAEQAIPLQQWLPRALETAALPHGERLTFEAPLEAGLPAVLADAGALQMILRNLLENSVRHARRNPVHVQLGAASRGAWVDLTYADDGQGGTPVRLGRLFGRGAESSGAGVGLYLVRRLMQRMGGSARFVLAPGQGFRATLSLRVAP